eukprot:PhF_6_TR27906/c0_g2_i1/m.40935
MYRLAVDLKWSVLVLKALDSMLLDSPWNTFKGLKNLVHLMEIFRFDLSSDSALIVVWNRLKTLPSLFERYVQKNIHTYRFDAFAGSDWEYVLKWARYRKK